MGTMDQLAVVGQVALAMVLGGAIGLDRELAGKAAGLRTHMLVAGAAALFVVLGDVVLDHFHSRKDVELLRSDPLRVLGAIMTGVSFLGAGTILRDGGGSVHGLTTAASFLFTAAIGACVGVRHLVLAVGVTLLALGVLRAVRSLEAWIRRKRHAPSKDSPTVASTGPP